MCSFAVFSAETETTEAEIEQPTNARMIQTLPELDDFISLDVAGVAIPATYTEDKLGEDHGVVILLHDANRGMDGIGVMSTLRKQLPRAGWSTLSVELDYPTSPNIHLSASLDSSNENTSNDETVTDTNPSPSENSESLATDPDSSKSDLPPISNQQRVEAAIAFLQAKNKRNLIFAGHGEGGVKAVELLEVIQTPIIGLVLISTPELTQDDSFRPMRQPILDVVASIGAESNIKAAEHRKVMMKQTGNPTYVQRRISGASRDFQGSEEVLNNVIRSWLKANFISEDK
jgi:predicted alpha/beta-hydrolase family hydrolase